MQRFFERPVWISSPNRSTLALWTFVEPSFVPEILEGKPYQHTPPKTCLLKLLTWGRGFWPTTLSRVLYAKQHLVMQ